MTHENRANMTFFRGKQAVLFINLLGKGLTQEISRERMAPSHGLLLKSYSACFFSVDRGKGAMSRKEIKTKKERKES